jgi:hypothetical protein
MVSKKVVAGFYWAAWGRDERGGVFGAERGWVETSAICAGFRR